MVGVERVLEDVAVEATGAGEVTTGDTNGMVLEGVRIGVIEPPAEVVIDEVR